MLSQGAKYHFRYSYNLTFLGHFSLNKTLPLNGCINLEIIIQEFEPLSKSNYLTKLAVLYPFQAIQPYFTTGTANQPGVVKLGIEGNLFNCTTL